ncbi:serine/threonine-protein kinase PknK [Haliangium sp.]|uniref:serine/threonine-protein kinase n=1 Tax=Haliangium sp. TaxID=2663208 RepID=UPI003D0B9DD2
MEFTGTDRFELRRRLGEGGMGVVHEAYDHERGMRVALKVLREASPTHLLRFKQEFRALREFSHPNIITLYELVSDGEQWFFTMELIEGEDMISYICQPRQEGRDRTPAGTGTGDSAPLESGTLGSGVDQPVGRIAAGVGTDDAETWVGASGGSPSTRGWSPLPVDLGITAPTQTVPGLEGQAVAAMGRPARGLKLALDQRVDLGRLRDVFGQLADALRALHAAGWVHRDLKPSNVLVNRDGRVMLMDFGIIADTRRPRALTAVGATQGTPAFMAPEQVRGEAVSAATDWYALGVILYLLLSERLPYDGKRASVFMSKLVLDPTPPSHYTAGIPVELERLCLDLLAQEPSARPDHRGVMAVLGVTPTTSAPVGVSAPELFIGRSSELDRMRDAYREAVRGQTGFVILEGGSGMGKTRLVEHFLGGLAGRIERACRVDTEGEDEGNQFDFDSTVEESFTDIIGPPLILWGRCHERERVPYKAFDGIMDQVSQHIASWSDETRHHDLPSDVLLLVRLFPVLRRIPECDVSVTAVIREPRALRRQAVQASSKLMAALALRQPVIIVIEDAQWIDRDSVELLLALGHRPEAGLPGVGRVLVIVCARSEDRAGVDNPALAELVQAMAPTPGCRRLALGPLSSEEQRTLHEALRERGQGRIPEDVWEEAAGHPMLLAELVRYAREASAEPTLQCSIEAILWQRVTRLPEPARELLVAVAVAGEPTPLRVVADAADLSHGDCERALARLEPARLVRTTQYGHEPWLDAYHGKLREAVLAHIDAAYTRRLHRALAQSLTAWDVASPLARGRHWRAAGAHAEAAACMIAAARAAARQLAFEHAIALYREVLDSLSEGQGDWRLHPLAVRARCQALVGIADALLAGERHSEAFPVLDQAETLARERGFSGEHADVHHLRGSALFLRGDLYGCLRAHQRARELASEAGDSIREARALSGLGDVDYLRAHMISAQASYDRCIDLCRAHGAEDMAAASLAMRGLTRFYQNDLGAALRNGKEALAMAVHSGHRLAEVTVLCHLTGVVWTELAQWERAHHDLVRARALAEEGGMRRHEAAACVYLARLLLLQGRRHEARPLVEYGLSVSKAIGHAYIGATGMGVLARILDDPNACARVLADGENQLRAGAPGHNHLYFYRDAMELSLQRGDHAGVARYSGELLAYTSAQPLPWSHFFVERAQALSAHALAPVAPEPIARLRELAEQARARGFRVAAQALTAALAAS